MALLLWTILAGLGLCQGIITVSDLQLLSNPEFEDEIQRSNWWCASCTVKQSSDSYSGLKAAKVQKRKGLESFLRQDLTLSPGVRYLFSAHIKLVNQVDDAGHDVELMVAYKTDKNIRETVCKLPGVLLNDLWVHCQGDFLLPEGAIKHKVLIRISDKKKVNFLVDKASLVPLLPAEDWATYANDQIDEYRKGTLQLSITVPSPYDNSKVLLRIKQMKHKFPFGSAIDTKRLFDDRKPENIPYRNYFYDMFNWAVFKNDLKWRFMEPVEGEIQYEHIDRSLGILDERGIPVRAHCVSWGKKEKIPFWLKKKPDEELKSQVVRRINYLTEHYKGRFPHWDVNNEDLHGQYYEEHTGNPQIMQAMFMQMNEQDPDAMLFTNDYEVTERSNFISSYKRQVMKLIADGAPVHGIGVQAHYFDYPDVHLLKHHLDELSTIGLPVWISELHYEDEDVEKRADGYEDFLRLAFSHPGVEGIIQWDFWGGSMQYPQASLVDGVDFQENAAGKRFRKLIKEEWNSTVDVIPSADQQDLETKLFYGEYEISLSYDGQELWHTNMNFTSTADVHKISVVVGSPFIAPDGSTGVSKRTLGQDMKKNKQMEAFKRGIQETKKKDRLYDLLDTVRYANLLDDLKRRLKSLKANRAEI